MKNIMKEAHRLAKEIKKEYPEVDYMAQLGICLSFLYEEECGMSKRAEEIEAQLGVTDEEAVKLEEVEKYYQTEENRDSKIKMNLWEKGSMRRVYITCTWRCNNWNSKKNYFDLDSKYLCDRYIGKQF